MDNPKPALTALSQELERCTARRSVFRDGYSTGSRALDDLLPGNALKAGGLVEWLGEKGEGAFTLALLAATQTLRARESSLLTLIDPERRFYPPALEGWGIPLRRVIVVRPRTVQECLWAWEQALRCTGVAACLGWMPETSFVALRRLQVAAEYGGSCGFLVRPLRVLKQPTWADVRWRVLPQPMSKVRQGSIRGRRFQVELLRCRNQLSGGVAVVEFPSHAAHPVRLAPAVADSTPPLRATGS
jgi:protein ImuA